MSTETRLRHELHTAASQLAEDHGALAQVMRQGARRRTRRRTSLAGAATLGAVAVAGALGPWSLPAGLPVTGQSVAAEPDVAIFFCDDVAVQDISGDTGCSTVATDEDIARVRGALNLDDEVADVQLETPQQAYERFADVFADDPALVASVDPDVFAASLRVTLAAGVDPADVERRYRAFDGVAQVAPLPPG
ncbi:MAG: hypothetical protein JJT89_07095 [Nitriliruptoraceae bacterium]|nr:hypothetical protein [Nitriliruptoraceae bacterium]